MYEESKEPSLLEEMKFLFEENVVGKKLIDLLTPSMKNVFSTFCQVKFSTEATAVLLALRAYQKEKGRLPDSLNELVPEYLSHLPLDPFDGKPLRYSKEKKIVYCVGRDLVDSGGNREWGFWGNWKDPGFPINF